MLQSLLFILSKFIVHLIRYVYLRVRTCIYVSQRLTLFPPSMTIVVCSLICLFTLVACFTNNIGPDLSASNCSQKSNCLNICIRQNKSDDIFNIKNICRIRVKIKENQWERSVSVVECLNRDRGAAGSSLTGVTALWSLSKTHLS